jgi:hypothetical protein
MWSRRQHPSVSVVRAVCPDCGPVDLDVRAVALRICYETDATTYVFLCPCCRWATSQPIEGDSIERLLQAGVPAEVWHLPAELEEILTDAAPFEEGDIRRFVALLDRADWADAL